MKFSFASASLLVGCLAGTSLAHDKRHEIIIRCNNETFTDAMWKEVHDHFKVDGESPFRYMTEIKLGKSFDKKDMPYAALIGYMSVLEAESLVRMYGEWFTGFQVQQTLKKSQLPCQLQPNAPHNLARLSAGDGQINRHQNGDYLYPSTGEGTRVYVVDTGINLDHPDFEGRAFSIGDTTGEGEQDDDGHGTHVAGIAGGRLTGVAKRTTLYSSKALGADGSGSLTNIIQAVQLVADHWEDDGRPSAVVNLSLGAGSVITVFNDFIAAIVDMGLPVVIAAGNENSDACGTSPAATPNAITVGSTDTIQTDIRSSFSNFGTCVDIFAVGSRVPGPDNNSDRFRVLDGTSQASPAVAGMVALILEQNPSFSPAQVTETLLSQHAIANQISSANLGPGSPNLLLQSQCRDGETEVEQPSPNTPPPARGGLSPSEPSSSAVWNQATMFATGFAVLATYLF